MATGSLLWFTHQILKIIWKERDGIEIVTDCAASEKLHQKESLEGQFLFLQIKKKPFQRFLELGFVFCVWFIIFFHNSQCGPSWVILNVIMQRGRTGTISPLKPPYWHNCKTKINCSLLPTPLPLMPASVCNFLLSAHYQKVILLSHLAGSWNSPNEVSRAEMRALVPQQKPCNIRCCYVSKLYLKRKTGIWDGFICNAVVAGLIWRDRWRQTL